MGFMSIYLIAGVIAVAGMIVQWQLQSRFNKYSHIPLRSGMTGADVARKMLADNGIYDVEVVATRGMLTDHYDPRSRRIALSEAVYDSYSVAAAAVAAHECGHAVQHAVGYAPLKLRSVLVPVVTFSSWLVPWVLILGILLINIFPSLLWLGIALFAVTTIFSVVTLPVEINASRRAIAWLGDAGITDVTNHDKAVDALRWAAYTYVIDAIGSIATLLYYIGIARRN